MRPLAAGAAYGSVAAFVALAANFYFLLLDPAEAPEWMLAAIAEYRASLALALFVFLSVLAALTARPVRLDPGVSRGALLVRDGALAATLVAFMIGATGLLTTGLQATVFADEARAYAREAAPRAASYANAQREEIREGREERGAPRGDLPPPADPEDIEEGLRPPRLYDLGMAVASAVVLAAFLGTVGAITGIARGRFGVGPGGSEKGGGRRSGGGA